MLPDIRQYICWHNEDRGEPKPTKVPFDPRIGRRIDHLQPANWMTFQEARQIAAAHQAGVGFVITAQDQVFCIDLDDVVQDNQWKPTVSQVYQQFPEAFCEISVSGKGLHIWGLGRAPENHRSKWNFGGTKIEFYSKDRFIALGKPLGGQFGKYDYSQILQQFVPVHKHDASKVQFEDRAAEGYTGPKDDDDLIRLMLNAPGSAAALFGDRASLVDLWTGDADRLGKFFPSDRDAFDRSSADAALCVHLAFWTGKNPARINRLFRRSGLMRDKWERPDYMQGTVGKACSMQKRFYDVVREPIAIEQSTTSDNTFLTADEIVKHFEGCVYISSENRVFCPDGSIVKPDVFRVLYGGKMFKMDLANRKVEPDAYKAFTQSQIFKCPMVYGRAFRPDLPSGEILTRHGRNYVNTYVPIPVDVREGDPSPFLSHVARLYPDPQDQTIILTYMISLVQNPGVKFQWCPVLQGVPGSGKTTLLRCLVEAIGDHYFYKPKAKELGSKFNAGFMNKLLIGVEEVHINDRREVIDAIKDVITDTRIEFEAKGQDQHMGDNRANWFMLTNHKDAIPKDRNDRRFAVFFGAHQDVDDLRRDGMTGKYFRDLYHWLEKEDGYRIVANYLHTATPVAQFDPAQDCERAPMTSTTEQVIEESRGVIEQEIMEAIESERRGFKGGFIGAGSVVALLKEAHRNVSRRAMGDAMKNLGYTVSIRASKTIMEEGSGQVRIYMKPTHALASTKERGTVTDAFMTVQGYGGASGFQNVVRFPGQPVQ
jgi:hypothetical protein